MMKFFFTALFVLMTVHVRSKGAVGFEDESMKLHRTRYEFADLLSKVTLGMSEDEVASVVGPPDETHLSGSAISKLHKTLCYGSCPGCSLATLGQICLEGGKVSCVHGARLPAPVIRQWTEAEMRGLLQVIDGLPPLEAARYLPGKVIEVVNTLQPMAKDKALDVIDEYLRIVPGHDVERRQRVASVLRILFEVPPRPATMQPLAFGEAEPAEPEDLLALPRFPLVLIDDVPLLVITGYSLAGEGEDIEVHVRHCRKYGRVRQALLRPTDQPFALLSRIDREVLDVIFDNRFRDAKQSARLRDNLRRLLMKQILSLLSEFQDIGDADVGGIWRTGEEKYANVRLGWDSKRNEYRSKSTSVD